MMKRKRKKVRIMDLIAKRKLAAGIGAESPECVGTRGDGLVADSPISPQARAAKMKVSIGFFL